MFHTFKYILSIFSLAALVMVTRINGFSQPLNLCTLTRDGMIQGMGGNHQNLGYTLKASGTNIELQVPRNPALRGFFLFATDENGQNIGTWTTSANGFQTTTSSSCPSGAISHSSGNVKALSSNPTFNLNLPSDIKVATVKAFAVHSRTVWQELDPISISNESEKSTQTKSKNDVIKSHFYTFSDCLNVFSIWVLVYIFT
ncbi:hypothetical protein HMI54_002775 [Coelomomyces lativittatus]|nr:hypothetical protein HMI56_001204 [Coelomomyces lativittatus]KAJ1507981.1 hypothetical protein HMI55_000562 [Coelomomyces lativittatus]KAJ1508955.1 hypothetical protein HMI54_002775 [Coelomomyces lativittatus]